MSPVKIIKLHNYKTSKSKAINKASSYFCCLP